MKLTATWADVATLTLPFIFILLTEWLVGDIKPIGAVLLLAWGMFYALRVGYRKGAEYAVEEIRETLQ